MSVKQKLEAGGLPVLLLPIFRKPVINAADKLIVDLISRSASATNDTNVLSDPGVKSRLAVLGICLAIARILESTKGSENRGELVAKLLERPKEELLDFARRNTLSQLEDRIGFHPYQVRVLELLVDPS